MQILSVHNAYQHLGGEDSAVEAEIAMLRQHGHVVTECRGHNHEIADGSRFAIAPETLWSLRTVTDMASLVSRTCLVNSMIS